jgi:rSAM/selenodomain-associated transferase 1
VAFTPSDCRQPFAEIVNGQWTLQPQGDGDLGDRLADFFARAFDRGFTRVVVIGADTPTLPIEFVMGAFALLKRRAAVFGPSADGGYYLIGAVGRLRGVFESIPWGTSEVWTLTRRRMEQAGLSWGELPAWWDVDDERDYRRLLAEGYRMSS